MFAGTIQGQDMMEQIRFKREELEHLIHKDWQPEVDYMVLDNRRFCLLKAGAEKLCDYFGYKVQYQLVQVSTNHVTEHALYIVKAILKSWQTGEDVAEGLGLASSQEEKYAGMDNMEIANTVLKTAERRAYVDAVITAVGGSFLFTQDLEEKRTESASAGNLNRNNYSKKQNFGYQNNQNSYQKNQSNHYGKNNNRNYGNQNKSKGSYQPKESNRKQGKESGNVTENQINYIEQLVAKLRLNRQQICVMLKDNFNVQDYRQLSKQQASDFIQQLREAG